MQPALSASILDCQQWSFAWNIDSKIVSPVYTDESSCSLWQKVKLHWHDLDFTYLLKVPYVVCTWTHPLKEPRRQLLHKSSEPAEVHTDVNILYHSIYAIGPIWGKPGIEVAE
jgi:hypothetical protein